MATGFDLGEVYRGLPDRPSPDLDRALDATERCIVRYGMHRVSMSDIAREMEVSRTTLYRQVSSLQEAMSLVASRMFHSFLDDLTSLVSAGISADTLIEAVVRVVEHAAASPIIRRILNDEPEYLGELVTSGRLPIVARQVTELMTPVIEAAAVSGAIRPVDAPLAAEAITRLVASLVSFPPMNDLEPTVRSILGPMLDPEFESTALVKKDR